MGLQPARSDAAFSRALHSPLPDTDSARVWARIKSGCDKRGRPIAFADAWIAAAAIQLNVPLVTHNARDFRAVESLTILTAATPIQ